MDYEIIYKCATIPVEQSVYDDDLVSANGKSNFLANFIQYIE